jgi:hypothetical protein
MQQLRLFVEASIEQARQSIEPDFSMRSSINVPMSQNIPFDYATQNSRQNQGISHEFEDVFEEEQKRFDLATNSVGVGSNQMISASIQDVQTDVNNLIDT